MLVIVFVIDSKILENGALSTPLFTFYTLAFSAPVKRVLLHRDFVVRPQFAKISDIFENSDELF